MNFSPSDMGAPGHLVERVVALIYADSAADSARWFNWSFFVAFWIGVVDEIEWRPPEEVQRDEVRKTISGRLAQLLEQGIEEEFLVRAVIDGLDRHLHHFADVGETDRKRSLTRDSLQETIDDPARRLEFRQRLIEEDPSCATISEADLIEKLSRMKDKSIASPVTPEEATRAWAVVEEFKQLREEFLSEELIEHWRRRNTLWQLGNS